jgi:hypothetical protein
MSTPAAWDTVAANKEALKEYYDNFEVRNLVLKEGPLVGLLPKMNRFGGKSLPIPMVYGNPQGASATLQTAIQNKTNAQMASFNITRSKDYAVASIDREMKLATEVDTENSAWLEEAKLDIDGARNQAMCSVAISLYGDGTGNRGQVSSGSNVATNTITLSDINSIVNFEYLMYVTFSGTRTGTPRTGQAQIVGIDRNAGTLTFSGNLSTLITGVAAGDYIQRSGDFNKVAPGIQSWLVPPALRPTASGQDNFYGQDRFADRTRMMGVYHDGTQSPIEESMIDLERKCAREGARVSHMFMNTVQFGQALKSLSSKVSYQMVSENARVAASDDRNPSGRSAQVSFAGIQFNGIGGPVKVFPDFRCPSTKLYALTIDTWKLYSLYDLAHIVDLNTDQEWLRHSVDDAYEVRVASYWALGCRAPGANGFADLAPAY